MHTVIDVPNLKVTKFYCLRICLNSGGLMPNKSSHHGENIHKMEQVPERPAASKVPDMLMGSRGNIPPAKLSA